MNPIVKYSKKKAGKLLKTNIASIVLIGRLLSLFDDNLIKYEVEQQRFDAKKALVTEK